MADGTVHRPLYGIDFHDDLKRGIAVGARGTVITTDDGGRNWVAGQLETPLSLIDVAVQGDRRITVGQMGSIWVSDSGEAWRAVESGTEERLMAVDMNAAGLAIAVGSFDLILLSYDSGESWEESPLQLAPHVEGFYDPHLYDVQVNPDGSALIVGEFGLILRTTSTKGETGTSFTRASPRSRAFTYARTRPVSPSARTAPCCAPPTAG